MPATYLLHTCYKPVTCLLPACYLPVTCLLLACYIPVVVQAQEQAELAQLQLAKQKALEQRDAQMQQLADLKARILAERCASHAQAV